MAGTIVASGLYLAWASIGKLATGHWGLFFLDRQLVGNSTGAAVAAAFGFLIVSPVGTVPKSVWGEKLVIQIDANG